MRGAYVPTGRAKAQLRFQPATGNVLGSKMGLHRLELDVMYRRHANG